MRRDGEYASVDLARMRIPVNDLARGPLDGVNYMRGATRNGEKTRSSKLQTNTPNFRHTD